jgi:hypothetical protein
MTTEVQVTGTRYPIARVIVFDIVLSVLTGLLLCFDLALLPKWNHIFTLQL